VAGGLVGRQLGEGAQVGFLHGVFCGIDVTQHGAGNPEQATIVPSHERLECDEVIPLGQFHQPVVGQIAQSAPRAGGPGDISTYYWFHVPRMHPPGALFPPPRQPHIAESQRHGRLSCQRILA
jgi:hypothetical protein